MTLLGQQLQGAPLKGWGEPSDVIRAIIEREDGTSAVYVAEYPPAKRKFLYGSTSYEVWMPWLYLLGKVEADATMSNEASLYALFSKTRQETMDEETLLIPLLPNMFKHGGVCVNHYTTYRTSRPINTFRMMMDWFWESSGAAIFATADIPPELGSPRADYWNDCPFKKWAVMSQEEADKIQWNPARYRSLNEAARKLAFKYWTRTFKGVVNDMTGKTEDTY